MSGSAASSAPQDTPKGKSRSQANGKGHSEQSPSASVFDNLDSLRINEEGGPKRKEKKLLSLVGTKRPSEANYFRVHPSEDMSFVGYFYTYETDGSLWFVMPGEVREVMEELTSKLRRVRLFLCVTKRGSVSFWPVSQTDQGSWGSSAREIAEQAKMTWVRVISIRSEGCYESREPDEVFPEPEWPDKPLSELLKLAFRGRIIDCLDHPILEELRGRGE
jgi:hypothetical protein